MATTNFPTIEQLEAASIYKPEFLPPLDMEYWQYSLLFNPKTERQRQYIRAHRPIEKGWYGPKPITDPESDWGEYGGILPWYPGVYRLHAYNGQYLPVKNGSESDPEGILYIGKADTWLKSRVPKLRKTHVENEKRYGYRLFTPEERTFYPKENLAISWLGCFDHTVSQALESYLLHRHINRYGRVPLLNTLPPAIDLDEMQWWIDNWNFSTAVAENYFGDNSWIRASLERRRAKGAAFL